MSLRLGGKKIIRYSPQRHHVKHFLILLAKGRFCIRTPALGSVVPYGRSTGFSNLSVRPTSVDQGHQTPQRRLVYYPLSPFPFHSFCCLSTNTPRSLNIYNSFKNLSVVVSSRSEKNNCQALISQIWCPTAPHRGVTVRNKNLMFNKIFINGVTVRRNQNFIFNQIFITSRQAPLVQQLRLLSQKNNSSQRVVP